MSLPSGSYVLDRFEGELAVLEGGGRTWDIARGELPEGALPGDTLLWDGECWKKDLLDTAARRERIDGAMARLFGKKDR